MALAFPAQQAGGPATAVEGGSHLTLISHADTVAKAVTRSAM